MPLITIFTAPKPFTNPHIALIQRNAIRSWMQLAPEVEVFLMGDEIGMAEVANEFGVRHFTHVRTNELGTPYISSMFAIARENSQAPILAIANADIIFMPDFVHAVRSVASQVEEYLVLGRRWDLNVDKDFDFSIGWENRLKKEVNKRGKLHAPVGSDYFVFPRGQLTDMPDFTIGRSGWDNWTIFHARQSGWAVVDITRAAMVVHQNHDYSHLPGGQPPYDLPETQRNIALAGGMRNMYTILEANKMLIDGKIRAAPINLARLAHRLELAITTDEPKGLRKELIRRLRQVRRKYEDRD